MIGPAVRLIDPDDIEQRAKVGPQRIV
jgi:hypothetical protein